MPWPWVPTRGPSPASLIAGTGGILLRGECASIFANVDFFFCLVYWPLLSQVNYFSQVLPNNTIFVQPKMQSPVIILWRCRTFMSILMPLWNSFGYHIVPSSFAATTTRLFKSGIGIFFSRLIRLRVSFPSLVFTESVEFFPLFRCERFNDVAMFVLGFNFPTPRFGRDQCKFISLLVLVLEDQRNPFLIFFF